MTVQALAPPASAAPPENYEHYFVPAIGLPVARSLVRAAALRPGERVLDVGCGTGVVARLAAEEVGPVGSVAGLDPHPGMLAVAAAVAPSALGIEWHRAGAESMPLPDRAFDVVLCGMALQFVTDRARALAEMRRVLAELGRIALNVPGPAAAPFEILADAMSRHIGSQAGAFVRTVFALHDSAEIEALLAGAGFRHPAAHAEMAELQLPDPADFLRQYVWSTPLAAIVAEASEEARDALEREVVAAWQRFGDGEGMRFSQRMVTATAVC
jgi:ubiquinone/menaquinone biosynthesis C-methylase UbiE